MDFPSDVVDEDSDSSSECDIDAERCLAHRAAAQGSIDLLVQIVKKDPGVLEQDDGEGYKPLAHAIMMQQLPTVKRLVKMGANINSQDSKGRTGLAVAAYQGWYEGVVYLLRKGAKQSITDKSGRFALHAATYSKDTRVISALLKNLSQEGVNYPDNEKMTAIQWAAFHNRPQHVQILLDHGADITVQDVDGKTTLHWAAQNGSSECCRILLQDITGATLVNHKDSSGKCPLHYAAAAGNAEVIELLASVDGTDPDSEDPDDRTPLHWAAAMGHRDCVSLLLNLGVKPNSEDMDGHTPLDYTRQTGHKACQKLIEERLGIKNSSHSNDKKKKLKDQNHTKNPFEKLKGLFKKKSHEVRHDDYPPQKADVPKLVLDDEEEGKENKGRRKRSKKNKVRHNQGLLDPSIPTISSTVPLPPVGSPMLPMTPRLTVEPLPSRRDGDLAPLRVPKYPPAGNHVLMHDKVAALRREREGQSRTPTPPPNFNSSLGHPKLSSSTSPTDLLHKKSKKKLEATAWSHPNSPSTSQEPKSNPGRTQLSPLAQYGQMSSVEKKTLDRTIHSLLQ